MTKTLNQIFFFLHQNHNIFISNIENLNIFFRKKKHTPPTLEDKMVRPLGEFCNKIISTAGGVAL